MGQVNIKRGSTFNVPPTDCLGYGFDLDGNPIKINSDGSYIILGYSQSYVASIMANRGVGPDNMRPTINNTGDTYVSNDTFRIYVAIDSVTWGYSALKESQFVTYPTTPYSDIYQYSNGALYILGINHIAQTIDGIKTFSSFPITPSSAPTTDYQVANRKFVLDSVVGLWDDRGNYDASVNVFPSTGGSGTAGAILKADIWLIIIGGTLGGQAVVAGQTVRALVDTPGQIVGNWAISASGGGTGGISAFDAAVSTIGELTSALAAGKINILLLANVTLIANLSITASTTITAANPLYTIDTAGYHFICSVGITINFVELTYTVGDAYAFLSLINVATVNFEKCTINIIVAGGVLFTGIRFNTKMNNNVFNVSSNSVDVMFADLLYAGDIIFTNNIVNGGSATTVFTIPKYEPVNVIVSDIIVNGLFLYLYFAGSVSNIQGYATGNIHISNAYQGRPSYGTNIYLPAMTLRAGNNQNQNDIITNGKFLTLSMSNGKRILTSIEFVNAITIGTVRNILNAIRTLNTLTISAENNQIVNGEYIGNISISGTADSTKLTGICLGTITLDAGVENCVIDIGVTTADDMYGGNASIINNSGNNTNRISKYKI